MVRQIDKLGDVCTHPDPPPEGVETVRCDLCMKPLVAADAYEERGLHFCCQAAAKQHFATDSSLADVNARDAAARHRRRIRKLIVVLIIVIAAVAGAWYYKSNKDKVDKRLQDARDKAQEQVDNVRRR